MVTTIIILVSIPLFWFFKLLRISQDKGHIKLFIETKGGELISQTPMLIGPFDFKHGTPYSIEYYDNDGNKHEAVVKASFISGINISSDKIVEANKNQIDQKNDISTEIERMKSNDKRFKWN